MLRQAPLDASVDTADVGQAYDVIPMTMFQDALAELQAQHADRNLPAYMVVKKQANAECYFAGAATPVDGCTVFQVEVVFSCALHQLCMKVYRFGNLCVIQRDGVPIGGPLSGCFLELVLGRAEHHFTRSA